MIDEDKKILALLMKQVSDMSKEVTTLKTANISQTKEIKSLKSIDKTIVSLKKTPITLAEATEIFKKNYRGGTLEPSDYRDKVFRIENIKTELNRFKTFIKSNSIKVSEQEAFTNWTHNLKYWVISAEPYWTVWGEDFSRKLSKTELYEGEYGVTLNFVFDKVNQEYKLIK